MFAVRFDLDEQKQMMIIKVWINQKSDVQVHSGPFEWGEELLSANDDPSSTLAVAGRECEWSLAPVS